MSYLTTNGRAGYRQAFESPQPQRASRTSILPMLTRRDHVQDEASHVMILCCARPGWRPPGARGPPCPVARSAAWTGACVGPAGTRRAAPT